MEKYLIDQNEAYQLLKHEAETHKLPESREAYERAMRIISTMEPYHLKDCNYKCRNCGAMCFEDDIYCSECGACIE